MTVLVIATNVVWHKSLNMLKNVSVAHVCAVKLQLSTGAMIARTLTTTKCTPNILLLEGPCVVGLCAGSVNRGIKVATCVTREHKGGKLAFFGLRDPHISFH